MLLEFATKGCNAAIKDKWSMELIKAAPAKGAHPSTLQLEPAAQLCAKTLGKMEQGYACLVNWDDIKDNPLPNLKISPIAAIPHKSQGYYMILDLSHGITINGMCHPSVNKSTKPNVAPSHALTELGHILPCLIYAVATAPDNKGSSFS